MIEETFFAAETARDDHHAVDRLKATASTMQYRTLALTIALAACSSASDPSSSTPADQTGNAPGSGATLDRRPFPDDNPWNADISKSSVDPNSPTLIASCGVRNLHPD